MALFTDSEFRTTFLSSVHNIIRRFYQYFNCLNNYWTRLSKIWWFVSGEQIMIDLRENTAIIGFDNCSSFGHRVCFLINICHFHAKAIARRRKARCYLRMSRRLFAAKHSWTTLRMNRPLFVGSYLQVTWWALGQWKGRKICVKW